MLKHRRLTPKIFLFLVLIDFLETFTQFCFKKAALAESGLQVKVLSDILHFVATMLSSPFLWSGLVSVLVIFAIWSTVLSRIDLSVAVPVSSFSYITIPLVSVIFLHESVSALRWCGISFIIFGIILVSISTKNREELR
jgi:drug/metabolite transporter (DMT)-like permease